MKSHHVLSLITILSFLIASCSSPDLNVEKIPTGHGPEDMALDLSDASNPRIIISCAKRKGDDQYGKIQKLDLKTNTVSDFELSGYSKNEIRPHGITLSTQDSMNFLYVISHEKNENDEMVDKIIKFRLGRNALTYSKEWTSDDIDFMDATNDLVVDPDGNIYCTNPTQVDFKEVPATVGLIRPDGSHEIIADGLLYPNGIYLDGDYLYVATTQENQLYIYQLDHQKKVVEGTKTSVAEILGGDNITKHEDELIIANHPSLVKFIFHRYFGTKSPSSVYGVNTSNGQVRQLYKPSAKYISASSTALIFENHLYISQVFEPFIVKIPMNELAL